MSDRTVSSKLNRLLQKSRQAYRIYASMLKNAKAESNLYSELQASQWMKINHELVRQLSQLIESRQFKNLTQSIIIIRQDLESELSQAQVDLAKEQQELIDCSKRGDYIRCAQLSTNLILKKSFIQAGGAAVCELSTVCGNSSTCSSGKQEPDNQASPHINRWHHINEQIHNNQHESMEIFDQDIDKSLAGIQTQKSSITKNHNSTVDYLSANHSAKVIQLRR